MRSKAGWILTASVVLAGLAGLVFWSNEGHRGGLGQAYAQQALDAQQAEQDLAAVGWEGAERLSHSFRAAAKVLRPAVVQINALVEQRPRRAQEFRQFPFPNRTPFGNDLFEELFRELEGRRRPVPQPEVESDMPLPKVQAGVGSGVVVSEDGYVLTNNHVVEKADELQVELSDGQTFKAEVVGTDPQ